MKKLHACISPMFTANYLLILFLFATTTSALAGNIFNTTTAGGPWNTTSTWTGNTPPANNGSHTANILGDVTVSSDIKGFDAINITGGHSFTSTTSIKIQSVTNFNVIDGDIIINGDLTLQSVNLVITNGSLTVTGTLTLKSATITYDGSESILVNNIDTGSSNNTLNLNSGSLTVTDAFNINSSTTINIATDAEASASSFASSNNSDAILNNAGTFTVNGDVSQGGVIMNNGTMNVNGSLTSSSSSSSIFVNQSVLNVTDDIFFQGSGKLYMNPGSSTIVEGDVTIKSNENLVVGTNVAPPDYADLAIKGDLIQTNSGDIKVDQNGRLAIFGSVTDSGNGGTLFTINDGGQVYVGEDVNYSGGGNKIVNNNTTDPWGFYISGTVNNTGGGASTTSNAGDEVVMQNTNLPFYNWVMSFSAPLPVTLSYFKGKISQQTATLQWATTSELNFDRFIIERSEDGYMYYPIGTVKGSGLLSVTTLNYTFQDTAPLAGKGYYRLKIVDLDDSFEYSAVIAVNNTFIHAHNTLRLYPNPTVNRQCTLELGDDITGPATIRVVNNMGLNVLSQVTTEHEHTLHLADSLDAGVYMVQVSTGSMQQTVRLVVQ